MLIQTAPNTLLEEGKGKKGKPKMLSASKLLQRPLPRSTSSSFGKTMRPVVSRPGRAAVTAHVSLQSKKGRASHGALKVGEQGWSGVATHAWEVRQSP